MNNKKITFTRHLYSFNCKINGQEHNGLICDEQIKKLINNVYNSDDSSEVFIRAGLRKLLNGELPGIVITDYKDGGITTIKLIK